MTKEDEFYTSFKRNHIYINFCCMNFFNQFTIISTSSTMLFWLQCAIFFLLDLAGCTRSARISSELNSLKKAVNPKLWITGDGESVSAPVIGEDMVKIVSYNVLGPLHGEGSKHLYAPVSVTKWTRRRDKVLEELRLISADIFCLQEVSAKGLKESFIPGLQQIGLECCAFAPSKKPEASRGKYCHKYVGCAIFSKQSKYTVLASRKVHLRDYAPLERCTSRSFHGDIMSKFNSMAIVLLRLKNTNQTVIVANSHLFWDPRRADIKAVQSAAAMKAIALFCEDMNKTSTMSGNHPVIFCGDFNSKPESDWIGSSPSSSVYGDGIGYEEDIFSSDPFYTQSLSDRPPELSPSHRLSSTASCSIASSNDLSSSAQKQESEEDFFSSSAAFAILYSGGWLSDSHPEHPDRWCGTHLGVDRDSSNPRIGPIKIAGGVRFRNAYMVPGFASSRPLFTTKTDDFQGWIDHVWVSEDLEVNAVLAPPITRSDLAANQKARIFEPIPNKNFPSDHLPIGVIVSVK